MHPSDPIGNMEVKMKTYGMHALHGKQLMGVFENKHVNSYLQFHLHCIDGHHFILGGKKEKHV